jgi:non-canonical purine NTP pyrophosphatase (RdgB/HAM1 family)
MKKLVLASNNAKKMKELNALLAPLGFEVIPQGQLGIPEAEEPHCTFVENALAKARHASQLSGLPALADDSGLCVAALGGAPGVYSAALCRRAEIGCPQQCQTARRSGGPKRPSRPFCLCPGAGASR